MSPPCALCRVVGQATNNCPKLPHLKTLVRETFLESMIPEVHVKLLGPPKKLKMLRTNNPCALCEHHGHYSHCFPCLYEFRDCLEALHKYEATHSGTPTPLPVDFGTISQPKQGNSGPTIVIPPPNVKMMDTTSHILYLSSSLSSS